ncbi:HPP family protein [Jiulongibacter sediminis]|uniref:HPP family protein n=1 Tax=Jiulongibacter sediminis TaxID=1605367 RepID=A0A0P7B8Z2_9BACT|nr:HPP family protein [Jiulongibacter sediminis]KPM46793.1 HPP family protein [Jiulongibacter sediminis]TBX21698.1 HPP family protein [Jiulongibacter sediminis]
MKRKYRIVKYIIYKETLINHREHLWTFLGGFIGIGLVGLLSDLLFLNQDTLFLIGSFGATAVLLYGLINSPLAQPRNLVGGHLLSAFVGVTIQKIIPGEIIWLEAAIAVSTAIVIMQITKTLHPPGGATALIAIIGSEKIKSLGYWYVLNPVFSGVMILLGVALLFNNITTHRSYPVNQNWFKVWKRKYY